MFAECGTCVCMWPQVSSVDQAIDFSNMYASEHLIVNTEDAEAWLPRIENAGSVFLGRWTPESVGDYASGTNHVLPTYGYARMYRWGVWPSESTASACRPLRSPLAANLTRQSDACALLLCDACAQRRVAGQLPEEDDGAEPELAGAAEPGAGRGQDGRGGGARSPQARSHPEARNGLSCCCLLRAAAGAACGCKLAMQSPRPPLPPVHTQPSHEMKSHAHCSSGRRQQCASSSGCRSSHQPPRTAPLPPQQQQQRGVACESMSGRGRGGRDRSPDFGGDGLLIGVGPGGGGRQGGGLNRGGQQPGAPPKLVLPGRSGPPSGGGGGGRLIIPDKVGRLGPRGGALPGGMHTRALELSAPVAPRRGWRRSSPRAPRPWAQRW